MKRILIVIAITTALLTGCEKDIDVKVPDEEPKLVVEAYVNSFFPNLNYVLITKTFSFQNPNFSFNGVSGAQVTITEGTINGNDTIWNASKILSEIPGNLLPGYYINPTLKGSEGKVYRLDINAGGKMVKGYTSIPKVVPVDSLTQEVRFEGNTPRYFLTVHVNEPSELGNNYQALYKVDADSNLFAWGDIEGSGRALFNDDVGNGVYRRFTYPGAFDLGDTLNYYFLTMDRKCYNFWESFDAARNNGGPFATPVQLRSNIEGAIGSFTGYGAFYRRHIFN